jgi:predicted lipoprotein with Yx(FWY)xxD motif
VTGQAQRETHQGSAELLVQRFGQVVMNSGVFGFMIVRRAQRSIVPSHAGHLCGNGTISSSTKITGFGHESFLNRVEPVSVSTVEDPDKASFPRDAPHSPWAYCPQWINCALFPSFPRDGAQFRPLEEAVNRLFRTAAPPAVCLAAFTVLTACQSGTAPGGYSASAGSMTMPMEMPADQTDPAKAALRAARAFDLGPVVVDGSGFAVYRYDRDSAKPSRSRCDDECAQKWLPVRASGDVKLTGIDRDLVGSVTRSDGTDQVTLAGWPLYRFTGDEMPGQTAGQGADRAWFPLSPDGRKIETTTDTWRTDAFRI